MLDIDGFLTSPQFLTQLASFLTTIFTAFFSVLLFGNNSTTF